MYNNLGFEMDVPRQPLVKTAPTNKQAKDRERKELFTIVNKNYN